MGILRGYASPHLKNEGGTKQITVLNITIEIL